MKKYLPAFAVLLLCCAWSSLDAPPITEATANDKKEQCKMQLDAMFYDYNIVLNSKNKEEKQFETIDQMQQNYFTDNALIEGNIDVSALHKERYEVKDYFSNLQEALSQLDASLRTDVRNIGDVCFDEGKNRYFLVANVDKTIIPHPGVVMNTADTVTHSVDIYYGFTMEDRKPKIFSIQQHRDDALRGFAPLTLISNEVADNSLSETKSYLVFNVTPSDAQVVIDGQPTNYTNGQQLEVAPGTHQVIISSNNYVKQAFPVTAESASTVAIDKNLDPQGGYLNVSASATNDYGSAVYINDVQIGNVPINDYPLATGRYNIQVVNNGYTSIGVVAVAENRAVMVNASVVAGQRLVGVIQTGYRPVTVSLLPRFYFTAPALHTFRGAIVDPYYTRGMVYKARIAPNVVSYRNNAIWHQQGQLFRPQGGYRLSGSRGISRPGIGSSRPFSAPRNINGAARGGFNAPNMQPANTRMAPANTMSPAGTRMAPANTAPGNMRTPTANPNMRPGNTRTAPSNGNMAPGNTRGASTNPNTAPANTRPAGASGNTRAVPVNTRQAPANTKVPPVNTNKKSNP